MEDRTDSLFKSHPSKGLGDALGTILLLTAVFFLNFVSRIILGPILPVIEQEMGLGHGQAGSLFLLISAGYCLVISLSGFISARLGHRWTVVLSSWSLAAALWLVAFSWDLGTLRLGLFLLGSAAGLYLPSGMATMTTLVDKKLWGRAIAVHELAPNLGFVGAPFLAELLCGVVSWRGVMVLIGIFSALVGTVFLRWGKGGQIKGTAPSPSSLKTLAGERDFWLMMGIFGLGVGGSLGVYAMLPLFLVADRSFDLVAANSLTGLSRISSMGMAFVGGWATDRLGPQKTMAGGLILSGVVTCFLGWTSGTLLVLAVFLQPALAVCFFPPALAALSRIGPEHMRSLSMSLVVPVGFLLGGGGIPAFIGFMGELDRFPLGISAIGLAMILSGACTRWLGLGERMQQKGSQNID